MSWYKIAKHLNEQSSLCGHCGSPLKVTGLLENDRHIYSIGQMMQCSCGESKIWTNSLRNPSAFVSSFDKDEPMSYYQGFCNDKYCGFCFEYLYPLKNGVNVPGMSRRADRWGCAKCGQNKNILMLGYEFEWGENVTPQLYPWFAQHIDEIRSMS